MRAVLVFNPNATTTDAAVRDAIVTRLDEVVDLDVQPTKQRGHASHIVAGAIDEGADAVFALGGDGTANEVIQAMAGTRAILGVIPGGGTNVLARALGLPNDALPATDALVDHVRSSRVRSISLGRAAGRYFSFHAGFGFDAAVVRSVEQSPGLKRRLRQGAFVWLATRTFFQDADRKAATLTLETLDGTTLGPGSICVVGNVDPYTWLQSRPVHVTPRASFDGGLDVTMIGPVGATRLIRLLATAFRANLQAGPDVTMLHDLDGFTMTSTVPRPLQVDGDYAGEHTEVRFESLRQALRVYA
ncbi:MAG TPA: diacylglycerol kinase family protein [Nitriliruptoraceae bacterium]|nr:diacylglycerol kinase family protein [Nitriliruptoraceae bacterium]